MRIVITTGIYPPEVGGPANYAFELNKALQNVGHNVRALPFRVFRLFPSGLRHILYFLYILPDIFWADAVIALDTFSVGLPSVAAGKVLGTSTIIRTGGDFLWEEYVERTQEKIVFSQFYEKKRDFTLKEHIIFKLTRWTLKRASSVIFSTQYQRDIFIRAYEMEESKTNIIENWYGEAEEGEKAEQKHFVCIVRNRVWKNLDTLKKAFTQARTKRDDIDITIATDISREETLEKIRSCYTFILVSLGDISPNTVLEALSYGKPVILTEETGLKERLRDVCLFVDPLDIDAIAKKILWLADGENYKKQQEKVLSFSFTHSYDDIAEEFIDVVRSVQ